MRSWVPGLRSDPNTRVVSRRDVAVALAAACAWLGLERAGVLAAPGSWGPAAASLAMLAGMDRLVRTPRPGRYLYSLAALALACVLAWTLAGVDGTPQSHGPLALAFAASAAATALAAGTAALRPRLQAALARLEAAWCVPAPLAGRRGVLDTTRIAIAVEAWRARHRPPRARHLLFSANEWEPALRAAFAGSPHTLAFGIDAAALAAAPDLVVPLRVADLARLEPARDRLDATALPLPPAAVVALCDDKLALNRALVAAGFGALVPSLEPAGFPYMLKRRHDAWGAHCHVVADATAAAALAAAHADPAYFRQAVVRGRREFTTHLLLRDGRVRWSCTLEFVFAEEVYVKGCRATPLYSRRVNGRCDRTFARMLRAVGFAQGLCCVNYKWVDRAPPGGGHVQVFEVNPRFGASLAPFAPALVRRLA